MQKPSDIQIYENIWLENNQKISIIKIIHKREKQVTVQIKDIENIEQAQKLVNNTIWIEKNQLKKIQQKDCYYYHQLKDIKIYNKQKVFIGKILDIQNFGAGDLIEIGKHKKHKNNFMLPFKKQFVTHICVEQKYAVIDNYQELLD